MPGEELSIDANIADERFRDREPTFHEIAPDAKRLLICSDERGITAASQALLAETYGVDPNLYNRDFGGKHGVSHDVGVVIAAQFGDQAFDTLVGNNENDNFTVTANNLLKESSNSTVIAIDHSADRNEHNPEHPDLQSPDGLGCAFDALFGAIVAAEATNAEVQAEGREAYTRTINPDPAIYDKVVAGTQKVFATWCSNNEQSGFSREAITRTADQDGQSRPVLAILGGSHVAVNEVVDIANYVPNSVASATEGVENGTPAFVTDMTDTTLQLVRAFRNFKGNQASEKGIELDPEYIFAAKILKCAAVRYALAGNKAATMAYTERGNAQEALVYIREALQTVE